MKKLLLLPGVFMISAVLISCRMSGYPYFSGDIASVGSMPDFLTIENGDIETGFMITDETEIIFTDEMLDSICSGELEQVGRAMGNVFEELYGVDVFADIRKIMKENGALGMTLTGSGPTYIGLFDNKSDASDCISELKKEYDDVFLAHQAPLAPAPDAQHPGDVPGHGGLFRDDQLPGHAHSPL